MPRRSTNRQSAGPHGEESTPSPRGSRSVSETPDVDISYGSDCSVTVLPEDTVRRIANEIVRYALFSDYSRKPIRRKRLYDELADSTVSQRLRVFREAFQRAQVSLRETFGLQMVPAAVKTIPRHLRDVSANRIGAERKKTATKEDTSGDMFFVTSILPAEYREVVMIPRSYYEKTYMGYVFTIVSLVILNGGSLAGPDLYVRSLPKALGLQEGDCARTMTAIGTIDSIVGRMIKQYYLIKERYQDADNRPYDCYFVGPRSRAEFSLEGTKRIIKDILSSNGTGHVDIDLERKLAEGEVILASEPRSPPEPHGENEPTADDTAN